MLGRGEHCPRERQHQREMVKFHEWCPVAFTELVTVLPNDLHDVFKMQDRRPARTGRSSPTPTSRSSSTLDINEYTDPHHDHAGVPHTVILSPGLRIEKVYVGYWFWGRPSIYQLWAASATCTSDQARPTTPRASSARRGPGWPSSTTTGRCGIYHVATLAPARRRGLAAGLPRGCCGPRAAGCTSASLQTTLIAERV